MSKLILSKLALCLTLAMPAAAFAAKKVATPEAPSPQKMTSVAQPPEALDVIKATRAIEAKIEGGGFSYEPYMKEVADLNAAFSGLEEVLGQSNSSEEVRGLMSEIKQAHKYAGSLWSLCTVHPRDCSYGYVDLSSRVGPAAKDILQAYPELNSPVSQGGAIEPTLSQKAEIKPLLFTPWKSAQEKGKVLRSLLR